MRSLSFCGVILAAGDSTRMGREKALLAWPPQPVTFHPAGTHDTFLCRHIEILRRHTDLVLVVLGANFDALTPVVYATGAFALRNPQPARGQFSSLQIGVQEILNRGRDAVVLTPVDRPPAAEASLARLKQEFIASPSDVWAVVPEFGGRHGHPIVAAREMISAWLRAPAAATAREVEHAQQAHIRYLAVDDPLVVADVNTPEDYARLASGDFAVAENKSS